MVLETRYEEAHRGSALCAFVVFSSHLNSQILNSPMDTSIPDAKRPIAAHNAHERSGSNGSNGTNGANGYSREIGVFTSPAADVVARGIIGGAGAVFLTSGLLSGAGVVAAGVAGAAILIGSRFVHPKR